MRGFRAWDKITKKYYIVSTLEYADNGELCEVWLADILVTEPNDACRNPKDVVLEQYTGCKDMNGKEIYEGDIVKLTGKVAKNKSTIYKVVWDSFLTGYDLISLERGKADVGYLNEVAMEERYDVIGNIHENHELLGEE